MSGLFGLKAQSTTDKRLNAMEINQSAYGSPIALSYGKTRVPMTLGWYGDFTATPHTTKQAGGKGGGKGGTNTTFTYSAALVLLLGEGQAGGVGTVWSDKAQVTLTDLGLTFFSGAGGQSPWSYLTTNHPSEAIGYDHTAYVANGSFQLGGSAAMPNLTFELKALLPYSAGTIDDAEPSAILIDYCTDANHGCGFPYLGTLQGAGNTYQTYCIAMGFFLSPSERTQRQAADFIKEILTVTNSECVWSAGVLKVVPLADAAVTGNSRTYTPTLTPQFTFGDDDFLYEEGDDPVKVTRKAPAERFNVIRVEYLDRANQYNTAIAEAKDANDIALNGERAAPTVTLHCIQVTSIARQVAQIILQRQLFVVNSYSFKVRADYSLLEPLDYVALNESVLGLSSKLVRITETDDSEDDEFLITAEEVLVGTAGAPLYNWQAAAGYAANYNAAPGSVSTPLIFTAPPMLVDTNGGYELWIAVSGPGALWAGCDVYMSLDNSSYGFVGTINGPARYGTLTATLASGTDPDTTHTLSVLLANTALQLVSGAAADVANNRTLLYVDGEIMAYQTATLTGAGAYNLTTLRRGQYGSTPASHASGTKFARIDGAIFRVPYDAGMVGQTAYFKFVSFNQYGGGYETLAGATAYSKVLASVNAGQLNPAALTLVGRNVTVQGDRAFKSAATSAWDADAYSLQSYVNGAFVSFRPAGIVDVIIGLNTDPTTDSNYTSIDYGMNLASNANIYAYESGTGTAAIASYATGDDMTVAYDGAIVRYLKNGVVIREVMAGPGLKFYLDSSFYTPGSTVTDIRFGPYGTAAPVLFNARGLTQVSDTNVIKQGGSASRDSDFYSIRGYQTCHITFKMNAPPAGSAPTTDPVVGFSTDPLSTVSYTNVNYGFDIANSSGSGGSASVSESGSLVGSPFAWDTTTLFALTYDGSNVRYYVNGVLIRTVADSGKTFYAKGSLAYPGEGINSLRFGPTVNLAVADTAQIGVNAAFIPYSATGSGGTLAASFASPTLIGSVTVPAQAFDATVVVTFISNMSATAGTFGGAGVWAYIDTAVNAFYDATAGNARVYEPNASTFTSNSVTIEEQFTQTAGSSVTYKIYACRSGGGTGASGDYAGWRLKAEVMFR